ncbi:MAG: M15 family metallopeptidase [Oscillospiraceae bacterium]|nr:M15 family metallopeptidase [Oscillospiraceae bacterium]
MTKKKRRRYRRAISRILLAGVLTVGLVFAGRAIVRLTKPAAEPEQGTEQTAAQPAEAAPSPILQEPEEIIPAPYEKSAELSEEDGVTYLTLHGFKMLYVNKTYSIPETYGDGVDAEAGDALQRLYDAAAADGLTIYTVSGYRSYATQKSIYENNIATRGLEYTETISARPGTSEHQTGLSFDVGAGSDTSTVLSRRFSGTPEYAWLQEHMAEYGFILRYPDGKTEWTGYVFEPWHIRYVGPELAQYIRSTGLCVEELAAGLE